MTSQDIGVMNDVEQLCAMKDGVTFQIDRSVQCGVDLVMIMPGHDLISNHYHCINTIIELSVNIN